MSLAPLLQAPLAIQFHVYTVVPAAVIGAYVLMTRKGTPVHKFLGRIWVALMIATSVSTFFIHTINLFFGFSPIHFLSAWVIFATIMAIVEARRGNYTAHRQFMVGTYVGGIVLAGLFTFVPGRIMNQVVLGGFDFRDVTDIRMFIWVVALVAGIYAFYRAMVRSKAV